MAKLTGKQQAFVTAYVGEAKGNGSEAARIAGYSLPGTSAKENLQKPHILDAIDEARKEVQEANPRHLTPERIHALWEEIASDPNVAMGHRLKALQDAARSQAMFVDRVESKVTGETVLTLKLPGLNTASGDKDE